MKCTDVRAALPLLIYGESSLDDTALKEHLAICPDCRHEHDALRGVRSLLNDSTIPHVSLDWQPFHHALTTRQLRLARRWRHVAIVFGSIAAVLLLAIGLRVEVRLEASQLIVRWGTPPPSEIDGRPVQTAERRDASPTVAPETREMELRLLSDLIYALKQDADERDQRFDDRLDRLDKHLHALQSQSELRWSATEENVAALYLLSRKGEKP
jgi:hypothetical protein